MTGELEEIKKTFIKNTIEELLALKKKLVRVKSATPEDVDQKELVQEVFLLMHGITGTAPMVGIDNIASVSGKVEMAFDKIRRGEKTYTGQLIVQALRGFDSILDELHAQLKDGLSDRSANS
ncbi:MAG: CheA signal transduction histidine kinase [Anaerophaga sp.]|uniref:Hpt domain-containing protein n=1 Tax=Anaerophaga thermohalophila TaxID=177400 RepID=UPI000237BCB4|nr:Hpt domain-containing protein [Anaerophaga thermohalophila]MBZ4676386.1 CheA signal transduction histidine kinase [Anaerophaga sp.]MDK2841805.1 two-component system, chemotaxis family, sensor kinase CheA [Anaerophaga sp.]MDN5291777.1 two-component system, chemotaxis family, sensor kinase CheA [Anaerophaga sp.]